MEGASGGGGAAGAAEVLRSLKEGLPPGLGLHYSRLETRPDGTTVDERLDLEASGTLKASPGRAWGRVGLAASLLFSEIRERL